MFSAGVGLGTDAGLKRLLSLLVSRFAGVVIRPAVAVVLGWRRTTTQEKRDQDSFHGVFPKPQPPPAATSHGRGWRKAIQKPRTRNESRRAGCASLDVFAGSSPSVIIRWLWARSE